jgi:hypothetical protein
MPLAMSSRPPRPRCGLALLAAIALIVAACQSNGSSSPSTGAPNQSPGGSAAPSAAPSSGALTLRVTNEGGFINSTGSLATLPAVSVYADGRIMTPGPLVAIYPGPLVPTVQVRSVGPGGAAQIRTAIEAAGLETAGASTGPGVPDVGQTVFTVIVDGAPVVSRFNGLGGGVPGPVASGAGNEAAALDLLTRLQDPTGTWGAASVTLTTYVPTAYRIWVAPGAPAADPSLTEPAIVWPLASPLSAFGTPVVPDQGIAGLRSGVVSGADATTLAPVLAKATAITPFTSGGQSFTLYVRPLMPDETP